ncbi:MAG: 50S ribosomal protein L31 [Candidatus Jacksonbacteria bacterium]|jgi:large subunit ribosomal protein L31|nr:50S ribosomal protein L31 [Candidatus Jacksonbacteria bacterium]MBT6034176.1 50S ribosomal protein L31 [Candidatus Jacksonbacteria bacterium]MBT6301041.1 50S ribosomal protein L31 [Candidatus Jacksonbacteria bacterium]MBT6756857.1 50S ribosomal protein L31 [Candidatus Jacksonbacteria bacterium]MBT6955043.1 50S ribosomal protein L31 [Candidatus Jacksonbacteria bacterium]
MKKGIHPKYNAEAKVVCSCGAKLTLGATVDNIQVEQCSACHPFYTGGGQKLIDTAGRVDRFKKRVAAKKKTTDKKAKRSTEERKVAAKASRNIKAQGEAIKKKLAETKK